MTEDTPKLIGDEIVEMSANIAEWAAAFPLAQKDMGDVIKSKRNEHFRSKYAELSDVIDAVMPALNEHGFSVLQPVAVNNAGNVCVTTMVLHKSGQWLRSTLQMKPVKPDPQGVGSAITYARRYALQAVAGVAPEDDDGNGASLPDRRQETKRPVEQAASTPFDAEPHDEPTNYRADMDQIITLARGCKSVENLTELWAAGWVKAFRSACPEEMLTTVTSVFSERRRALSSNVDHPILLAGE